MFSAALMWISFPFLKTIAVLIYSAKIKKTAGPCFRFAGGGIDSRIPGASGEPSVKVVKKTEPAADGGG
jgi:hypothetical protein